MKQILLTALLFPIAVNGLAQNGRLAGRVVDPSGRAIGGADITLMGPGNTKAASAKSNPDGSFTISAPSSSSCALQVTAPGFDPSVQGVSLSGSNTPITVTLDLRKPMS